MAFQTYFSLSIFLGVLFISSSSLSVKTKLKSKSRVSSSSSFSSTIQQYPSSQEANYENYVGVYEECKYVLPKFSSAARDDGYDTWYFEKVDDEQNDTYRISVTTRNCPSHYLAVSLECEDTYVELKNKTGNAYISTIFRVNAISSTENSFLIKSYAREESCETLFVSREKNGSILELVESDSGSGTEHWLIPSFPVVSASNNLQSTTTVKGKKSTKSST